MLRSVCSLASIESDFIDSTKAEVKTVANIAERLVPIRLDIDVTDTNEEHRRYRDTFLWNAAGETGQR